MNKLTVNIIFVIGLAVVFFAGVEYGYVSPKIAMILEAAAIGGAVWDVRRHA